MKAFIYVGGAICASNITEHPKADDLCIAADIGAKNAKLLGDTPEFIVGDFDSTELDSLKRDFPQAEITVVPAEKDFTDSELAIETALSKGATEIVIIGGLGGRLDHTLSNLAILEKLYAQRVHALITDGYNRVRFLDSSSTLVARSQFKYVSILATSEKLKGVDIEGCKYPLKNATILRNDQFAVSNEITGNCALISVRKGQLYIIESTDC